MIRPAYVLWRAVSQRSDFFPRTHDFCTVEQDSYTGEIAVKRISSLPSRPARGVGDDARAVGDDPAAAQRGEQRLLV